MVDNTNTNTNITNDKIYLTKLEPFMNKKYFDNFFTYIPSKVKVKDYSITNNKHLLPCYLQINFTNETSKNTFKDLYNNKKYQGTNITITMNDTIDDSITENINKLSLEDNYTPFKFSEEYHNMISLKYERILKEDGLVFKDKQIIDNQSKVVTYLIKRLGKSIFNGESIMNISLPVNIFDKRSLLQVFAYEQNFSTNLLNRAYFASNDVERHKWVATFMMSSLHLSPLQTKPFNPIIGETLQLKVGDLDCYLEHVSNKPPISRFYCKSDNFTISGSICTEANTSANSIKATKTGKYQVIFKDGHTYSITPPSIMIKGMTLGKRLFYYRKCCMVVDEVSILYYIYNNYIKNI